MGGVHVYPLGAAGAKSIELSSNLSTVTLAVYQWSKEGRNGVGWRQGERGEYQSNFNLLNTFEAI